MNENLVKGLVLSGLKEDIVCYQDYQSEERVIEIVNTLDEINIYLDISNVSIEGKNPQQLYDEFHDLEYEILEDTSKRIVSTDTDINILKRLIGETSLPNISHINFVRAGVEKEVKECKILEDSDYLLEVDIPYNTGVYTERDRDSDCYVNNNAKVSIEDNGKLLSINISEYKDYEYVYGYGNNNGNNNGNNKEDN